VNKNWTLGGKKNRERGKADLGGGDCILKTWKINLGGGEIELGGEEKAA
jgi:hypothetical protein